LPPSSSASAPAIVLCLGATNPAGARQIDSGYDALGQLVSVTDEHGTTTYEYDPVGNRILAEYPNGITTQYGYDARNRLIEQIATDSTGNLVQHLVYTLDATGKRTRLEERHSGRTADWSYDDLGRLTSETVSDPLGGYTTEWTYDKVGNRLTQIHTPLGEASQLTSYRYDQNDRLITETTAAGITSYAYDPKGNRISQSGPEGSATYTYDPDNRLVAADTAAGTLHYTYDANGIRQSRTENGSTTRYLIDPNQAYAQVLAEYDETNSERIAYTRADRQLISQTTTNSLRYHHQDGLGSTRILTDASGVPTDRYDYRAFGELDIAEGATPNDFLYTGEQFDPGLNLYYLRARYMDPASGRFTQQDSWAGRLSDPITLNRYLYADADPSGNIDPSGKESLFSLSTAINVANVLTTSYLTTTYVLEGDYEAALFVVAASVLGAAISTVRTVWAAENAWIGVGATGKVGENFLRAMGGQPQAYFPTTLGKRYIDQLINGIAHESKVGVTSLSKIVEQQVMKDMELLQTREIRGAVWHFFRSPVTGMVGPSGPLKEALENAGIRHIIHNR